MPRGRNTPYRKQRKDPMKDQSTDDALRERLELIERAIDTAAEGITISDALSPDNPIIYANKGFERLTGYIEREIVGRNCRFLQGPRSDLYTVRVIREAIGRGEEYVDDQAEYPRVLEAKCLGQPDGPSGERAREHRLYPREVVLGDRSRQSKDGPHCEEKDG